ncbi:MAG: hypothetical protein HOY78_23460 [Saccharothrix sp.]|nr:hypothetical protein [Saccharothrix sp.]
MIHALLGAVLVMASPTPVTTSSTFADFSRMTVRSAGQVWADGAAASQWAWKPLGGDDYEIAWGNPATWPPSYGEHFVRNGDWVLVNGYFDHANSNFNTQRVTSEHVGNADCADMQPLPSDGGRQHYVRWTIPATGYCLHATGTITVGANGAVVHFRHEQIWYPPAPCTNQYLGTRTCIRQHERWYDDKGHPFSLSLERDQYLAQGLGMGFKIDHTYDRKWQPGRQPWHAALRYTWDW